MASQSLPVADAPPTQADQPAGAIAARYGHDGPAAAHAGERQAPGLRLTKLTLVGFKSFADRTEFTFDQPITGVVGPNGCGKSNLVDAIKWVLGERSSKSLRGKEMLDVVFAGSAARRPSGFASVTLTFKNPVSDVGPASVDRDDEEAEREAQEQHDGEEASAVRFADRGRLRRPLPIDAEEVAVERQLHRDGTSRYVINGRRARLRDIRELFLDTGIGADAYSIIEQGKVDAMLLASPQERRSIFEEAAGVARYKQRRIEAERKLEKARSNLALTREQLESTERRLRIVRGQAAKARRYKELDDELSALRLAVAFDQYDAVRGRLDALKSELESLEAERESTQRVVGELESAKQTAELERHEASSAMHRAEQAAQRADAQATQAAQRGEMARRSIDEARRQAQTEQARVEEAERRARELADEVESAGSALAEIGEQLADGERELERLGEARAAAQERITDARAKARSSRGRVEQMDRERSQLAGDVRSLEHRCETAREQRQKQESRRASLEEERAGCAAEAERVASGAQATRTELAELESRQCDLDRRVAAKSTDRGERAAALAEREHELSRLDSRRATLDEMVRSRVGLGDAVRAIMDRRDADPALAGVIGPLAELLETDAAHAAALEASLGSDLRAVVVESLDAIPPAELLASLPGRVSFLAPRDADAGGWSAAGDPIAGMLGARVETLRNAARARGGDMRIEALLDRLLGACVLVESLDTAMLLAAGPMHSARFVTRDGAVLDTSGRITAGPMAGGDGSEDAAGGVLERAAELADLERRVSALTSDVASRRESISALDADLGALTEERSKVDAAVLETQRALEAAGARGDRLEAEADRLAREIAGIDDELERLKEQERTAENERTEKAGRVASLDRLIADERAAAERHEKALADAETAASAAAEQLSAAKVEVSTLTEQRASARRSLDRAEQQRAEADRQAEAHRHHAQQARERCEAHEHTARDAAEAADAAKREAQTHRDEAASLRQRVEAATREAERVAGELSEARTKANAANDAWNEREMSRREADLKRQSLEERTFEELGVDLDGEHFEYRVVMRSGDVEPIDTAAAHTSIAELRGEIKKLGNVNLDAIEEEDNLAEKNEALAEQVADIDAARAELVELIEKLNVASRERFGEAFERIRAHFGGPDGMFRKLFGGGRAEVRLMPLVKEVEAEDGSMKKVETDEVDVLESGIEVIAKPPGKEPRSISQLSGGEKTLTAVALLMSIFRSKPSCFCVLDEVDAALDEANVGRYCAAVRSFTDMSRFIVITHNKKTMQMCDHLYGVTQREKGVSSRVSVKFEQVGSDGSIKEQGSREARPERGAATEPLPPDDNEPPEVHVNGNGAANALRRAMAGARSG